MDSRNVTISRSGAATTASFAGPSGGSGVRLQVPEQIGPVKLLKPLGEGGMGVVWFGRHELLQRDVAVKFLLDIPQSDTDPTFAAFLQGARAAAALRHQGLNEVHHADVAGGVPYLVMEYIDGPSLSDIVKAQGPLSPSAARAVLASLCAAVAELHDHEVIHRDIKPANIMLTSTGRVVVTDFGLACPRPAAAFGASTGTLTGSPAYMAPEMFDGIVSSRTDVYAIGITAYHLLAGRFPFDGTVTEIRESHRGQPLDAAPLHDHHTPALVIEAIERATNKNVLFRPRSARQVLDLFEDAFKRSGVNQASADDLSMLCRHGSMGASDSDGAPSGGISNASSSKSSGNAGSKAGGVGSAGSGAGTPGPKYYDALSTLAASKRRTADEGSGSSDIPPPLTPAPLRDPPRGTPTAPPVPPAPPPAQQGKKSWWRKLLEGG